MVYDLYAHGGGPSKVPVTEVFVGSARTVSGTTALTVNTWAHLATTFDGATLRLYVNGSLGGPAGGRRLDRNLERRPANRRQHALGRALRGPHRRGADLPARADGGRDPGRHERAGGQPRRPAADGARQPCRKRRGDVGRAHVDGVDGQRRRRAVQRPPLDDLRVHADHREPDRAADGDEPYRLGPRRRDLLLPGPRRGRGGQPLATVERGERRSRRHHAALGARHPDCDGRDRQGDARLGSSDGRRGGRALQRPPLHDVGLHAGNGEPDRAADRHELHGHGASRPAPTTTRSPPRTPRATSGRPRTRRARP